MSGLHQLMALFSTRDLIIKDIAIYWCTLVYLIIVQDGINVQDGKIAKINKRAGWNKAVQVGIFQNLLL